MHWWCLYGPINSLEHFDTLPIQCRHIEHMHEGVWFRKNNFWQKWQLWELRQFFPNRTFVYVPLWADQLLPQLLMKHFDTLPKQCRHIEHSMKEIGSEKIIFDKNDSCENLDNFSLIGLLYMHRWCLHGLINSYHSFWWSNLILCLYNEDTLKIRMKEFGSEIIIFDKMIAVRTLTIFP